MQISTHFWGVIKSEGARAGGADKGLAKAWAS